MNKYNKLLIISFFLGTIFSIIVIKYVDIGCIFKNLLNIPCPGCGLTRAFRALFKGDFINALYYNYLVYILVIGYLYGLYLIIKDLINKSNSLFNFCKLITTKYYLLIILLLIISEVLNIVHGI